MTLRIFDLEHSGLAFDLRDLLRLFAPLSLQATWTVSPFEDEFEATGEGAIRLEKLADNGASVIGSEFLVLAEETWQVIWGEFVGVLPGKSSEPWVTIRAVDSSFYEVETSDSDAIDKLKARFSDVRFSKDGH